MRIFFSDIRLSPRVMFESKTKPTEYYVPCILNILNPT